MSMFTLRAAPAMIALAMLLAPSSPHEASAAPGATARATNGERFGELPLNFERNLGQVDASVEYLARGPGYTLFLTPTEAVFSLMPRSSHVSGAPSTEDEPPPAPAVVRMAVIGGNQVPAMEALEPQASKSHYFSGRDPGQWQRDVGHYGKIRYQQVYDGIDLVYYGSGGQFEYDFVVAPGADPGQIAVGFEGVDGMRLDRDGNLLLATPHGDLIQHKPVVFQDIDGERHAVQGDYRLLPERRIAFELGRYDRKHALVIDPVIAYSTFLGGSNFDEAYGIAVDAEGASYVTGETGSVDFPVVGAVDPSKGTSVAVFISKLNAAGTGIVYSTYIDGSFGENGSNIAVDAEGSAYVAGATGSFDFPTRSAFQPAHSPMGGNDGFVLKLSADGSELLYSTYLGGTGNDDIRDIAIDAAGNAHVIGLTRSIDFPVQSALQPALGGGQDAFIAKLNASGTGLLYSTYFGGSGDESAWEPRGIGASIALDAAGNAYITGSTNSANLPVFNAIQPSLAGTTGQTDAYVAKLNNAGNALVYSTYLGGRFEDRSYGIDVDALGNAYVAGRTQSDDFPTASPMQPTNQLYGDGFVTKIDPAGAALVYSTYIGGNGWDAIYDISVDGFGNAHLTGQTGSSGTFPLVGATQAVLNGGKDAFVATLNAAGNAFTFSTFLGGIDNFESARRIALDSAGNTYVVGRTSAIDFPLVTPVQATYGGGSMDVFIAKYGNAAISARASALDFDGDGRSDILWRNLSTGADTLWLAADVARQRSLVRINNLDWEIVAVGDFEPGDGAADIFWRNGVSGANVIWPGGDYYAQRGVTGVRDTRWEVAGAGDFDGDAVADVLWRHATTGANVIWRSGDYADQLKVTRISNLDWQIVGTGDFDGDAVDDILWRNRSTGANVVWKSANYARQQGLTRVSDPGWKVAGVADFDGDRVADILWRHAVTGANRIWQSGSYAAQRRLTGVTNLDWQVAETGDYNGDGKADILWRNRSTGANTIWLSGHAGAQQRVARVPSANWAIVPERG